MRTYELVFIVKALSDADRKKVVDGVKELLGKVTFQKENEWGSKLLKYKIKKELTGYYYDFVFDTEMIPVDFTRKVLRNASVLRHLVIRRK